VRADIDFDIFISYAQVDTAMVLPFVERLKTEFKVWIDREQMAGGRPVLDSLGQAIARSAHTIAFLTDDYLARDYTTFELQASMNRDPASKLARTIPVRLHPLTRELPVYIQQLMICDLTDSAEFERTYQEVTRSIRSTAPRPQQAVDEQAAALACDVPFQHLDQPEVALFLVLRAADAMARFLYRREIGLPEAGVALDAMYRRLLEPGPIPDEMARLLSHLRMIGGFVVDDRAGATEVTRESIEPALSALRELSAWAFPGRRSDRGVQRVLAVLPRVGDPVELELPGTRFRLRPSPTGVTGIGPLFAGRDTTNGDAIAVTLVDLPADRGSAFLEPVRRCADLRAPELLTPIGFGPVSVGDDDSHGFYLAFPAVRDVSVQDLLVQHGDRLPIGPAYDVALGVVRAAARLRAADPPLALGTPAPADIVVSRFGSVRLRCPGWDTGGPDTGFTGLAALLRGLLIGRERADLPDEVERTLQLLAECRSAAGAEEVLLAARHRHRVEPGLGSLVPAAVPAPGNKIPPGLELVESYTAGGRRVWPLGRGRVLVWETGTETLALLDGPGLRWRDDRSVAVRVARRGRAGQLAVGGWDGAVRSFAVGELVAATVVDGAIGDLAFVPAGLIAGSWKRSLALLPADGPPCELLGAPRGVHRIAAADGSDRFAVADLSGRVSVYQGEIRVQDWRTFGAAADLAYAGSRLVVLTDGGLTGVRLDGAVDGVEPKPGAQRLLPGGDPGTCVLLATTDPRRTAPGLEVWTIYQDDRHILQATFPVGYRLLSTCAIQGRFTVARPDGGCAYWYDGTERRVWPDAVDAALTADGRQVAVARPDRVELYAASG
jgi:hypothetical protein